jgi:isoleucyl-tRNA synthetase
VADDSLIQTEKEARMEMAQDITSMVLALRRKADIKVRQPLKRIMVPAVDQQQKERIEAVADTILNEVNVKELQFAEGMTLLVKKLKCNFRTMGKKYGKLMKGVAAAMAALDQQQIAQLEKDGTLPINVEGQSLDIDAADVEIISEDIPGWLVANEGNLTVALEVTLTEELVDEGMARELVKRVQKMRKDGGLEITDRIQVVIDPAQPLVKAMEAFGDYVKTQVLADEVTFADNDGTEVDFEDFKVHIQVKKSN